MSKKIFLISLIYLSIFATNTYGLEWQHKSSTTGNLPKPFPDSSRSQTASLVLDVDRDGDQDFVIAQRYESPSVVLYRYNNNSWTKTTIDNSTLPIEAGGDYHDIDGDGDLDISFAATNQGNSMWWWENPNPNFSGTWTRRFIKNSGSKKHHDQIFGDFDNDGKTELAFWNQSANGALMLAEIPNNPKSASSWSFKQIANLDSNKAEGLASTDVNIDGKLDIVGAGYWYQHKSGITFTKHQVANDRLFTRSAAGQLIPGGYAEIVLVPGDADGKLSLYQYQSGSWKETILENMIVHGHSLYLADFNNDGKLDIFVAEMRLRGDNPKSKMYVYINQGNGKFERESIAQGYGNHESKPSDLDGDGDIDILGKPHDWEPPRIDLWLQKSSGQPTITPPSGGDISLNKWKRHVIDNNRPWRSTQIEAGDLNGDNKPDIITGGWWYQNPGSPNGSWTRKTVGSPMNNFATLHDFDKDGDIDILGTQGNGGAGGNPNSNKFAWGQNNGSGNFSIKTNIAPAKGDFLQGVVAGTIQSKQVALSWHKNGGGVQTLTIPSNPASGTWTWKNISTTEQKEDLSIGDINKDGKNDLLLGTKWLKNTGKSWATHMLFDTTDHPDRNDLADINKDGKLDTVIGYEAINKAGKVAWYQQPNNATSKWSENIISKNVIGPMSVDTADMDADGDMDVVVGEHNYNNPTSAKLYVFENLDKGLKWEQHLVHTGDEHHDGAQTVDIDNDGDLDIISIGWKSNKVTLYENTSSGGGSQNNLFSFSRIVHKFTSLYDFTDIFSFITNF